MKFKNGLKVCILVFLGFILPLLGTLCYFHFTGHLDEYFYACWEVPSRYSSALQLSEIVHYIGKFHLKFLPIFILMYFVIFRRVKSERIGYRIFPLMLLWLVFAMVATIVPGKYFEHYYLQLSIPICWIAADVLDYRFSWIEKWVNSKKRLSVLFLTVTLLIFANQSYFFTQPDRAREAVKMISEDMDEGDLVFAGNRYQILYFLLDSDPPIKYVHPSLLTFGSHIRTLEVDPQTEYEKMFAKNPKYIVLKDEHPYDYFNNELKLRYEKIAVGEINKCLIYKMNEGLAE